METWDKLFATTFFQPCPRHPGHSQRYYCYHTKAIFCEECKEERGCTTVLKIYRHMYHDVVRVPFKKYINIQTFMSNGHSVVFLRPHKSLEAASNYEHHCRCGRGTGKAGWFCSAHCYFASVHEPKKSCVRPKCPPPKFSDTVTAYRRRKPMMPEPSPVC